jgi:hypothetical protein
MEETPRPVEVEIFEDVEEIVTASWTGCASCCN